MKVAAKDVAHIADLANLQLGDEEQSCLLRDLNSILDYIDKLNELDTANVPPMSQASRLDASRDDDLHGLRESLPHEVVLQKAPDSDGTFFKVPKVIER
jgi:aspartyl-tRNA(Asn)/glutamyl-tRNA(Gln) amidotransferase subunit C